MVLNNLQKIMFLDIETVPQEKDLNDLPLELVSLWNEKFSLIRKRMPEKFDENTTASEAFNSNAGIYSEFGKIVCISVGFIWSKEDCNKLRIKSFANDDEQLLLSDFINLVLKFFTTKEHTFCGHNIKEFDIPYICRRILINNLKLPDVLQIAGKKPWEVPFIDTLELWKFGDIKNYTSLKLLTSIFNIPTPKDDIDGSQVAEVYYIEKNLKRISDYCQKDVAATVQLYLKLAGKELIEPVNIEFV